MKFRPCIDLHNGKVKQIVGGSLNDKSDPTTNFVSEKSPAWYAKKYKADKLKGGHVIKLGPNNDDSAKEALFAWPQGLQVGGGITADNATEWLNAGAAQVIVTSYIFQNGQVDDKRLTKLVSETGKDRLVLDLSCRQKNGVYYIVTDRWQTFTETAIDSDSLTYLASFCSEFLIHGVDVEGKQQGMDEKLIRLLADKTPNPCVYAGGVRSFDDLKKLRQLGNNKIDVTIGSALDMFGGSMSYDEVVRYCD